MLLMSRQLPPIPRPLMDALELLFPERCPNPNDSEREIWMKAGERRVITVMRQQYERQVEAAME